MDFQGKEHRFGGVLFVWENHFVSPLQAASATGTAGAVCVKGWKEEAMPKNHRADVDGPHRQQYQYNRKRILATQSICALCGKPVDKSLKSPHPMSPSVDHIIPVAKGGHPSEITNLQLAHRACNRAKADRLVGIAFKEDEIGNRDLPLSHDWKTF